MTVSILQLRSWQDHISFGRKRIVGQHLPSHQPLTNWIFLSVVLGYPSVPSFENYIIQDPKAFYVLTGIGFDHGFNDSKEPLPLEVRASFPSQSYCATQP